MKSLVIAVAVLGATSLPVLAQQSNMNSDEPVPTMSKAQPMPAADGGQSGQSYGMSTSGSSQSGKADLTKYQLTPAQQDLYRGN